MHGQRHGELDGVVDHADLRRGHVDLGRLERDQRVRQDESQGEGPPEVPRQAVPARFEGAVDEAHEAPIEEGGDALQVGRLDHGPEHDAARRAGAHHDRPEQDHEVLHRQRDGHRAEGPAQPAARDQSDRLVRPELEVPRAVDPDPPAAEAVVLVEQDGDRQQLREQLAQDRLLEVHGDVHGARRALASAYGVR